MKYLKIIQSTFLLLVLAIGFCTPTYARFFGSHLGNQHDPNNLSVPLKDIRRFTAVIGQIKHYYVEQIEDKKLFDNAIRGLLSNLDPHSTYLDEEELRDLEVATVGKFGGVGIEIVPDKGAIEVISPLDGTPADKAGIKAGDLIVRINKKLVKDMTIREAVNMMRGKKGTKVTLTLIRPKERKPIKLEITRDIIKVDTVRGELLDKGYAYIRLAVFQQPTGANLVKELKKLKQESDGKLKGLILDLRNNPGGLLDAAIEVTDHFIDASALKGDKKIVYTKGRLAKSTLQASATRGDIAKGVPIVVLINGGSASASEIVAGALQDYKRAVLVGTRSFGKGSVQTVIPIDSQSAIKLTTALYYTPKGRSIQAEGIKPDVVVENLQIPKSDEDTVVFDPIREKDLNGHFDNGKKKSKTAAGKKENTQVNKYVDKDLAHTDFQLYEALNLLRGLHAVN